MKILVIGDGKVGKAITSHLCQERHDITVIDTNPKVIENLVDRYDVIGICGNGATYEILMSADVSKADVVIAATSSDETNILSCLISKKLGARKTIARVRNYDYNRQIALMKKDLNISMTINPEFEAANEILKVINFPSAIRVDSFANGNVDLIEVFIHDDSQLIGLSLASIHNKFQVKVLVCAVQRGDEVFIPSGDFVFQAKDKIHITASRSSIKLFLYKLGLLDSKIRSILIVGGSKIALYLAEKLAKNKYQVKIIEKDHDRCLELSELLPGVTILQGDGCDQSVLNEEGIESTDAVICLTGIDEENIIISMYANKVGVSKIVTKVDKSSFADLLESIGVASVISPKEIVASSIVSYVRALDNSTGSSVITLYKLVNNKVEALEFLAKENSPLLNITLNDLQIKKGVLIAGIFRNEEIIIPSGNDVIMANDRVIVVTTNQFFNELEDILV